MRLKSFRIFRYKSIVDSGECTLASDFTILIGKNESGKTAILEALRDFDRDERSISSQAVTINGMHGNPELELTFEISSSELDAVLHEADDAIPDDVRQTILSTGITLRKTLEGEYRFKDSAYAELFSSSEPADSNSESDFDRITSKKQRLSEILNIYPIPELKLGQDIQNLQDSIRDLRRFVKSRLNFVSDESQKVEAVEILHSMTNAVTSNTESFVPRSKFMTALIARLPRFIYFSDFKDILPFEISIDAMKNNQTVCDFARLAKLDLDAVISTQDLQRRINLLNRASAVISGSFFDHWEQDRIELLARPEGNKILFGVKEHSGTDFFKMEQRSRGFQWFLSFYLRINRYQNDNVVLLVDEPGMNLHPMAQKNILNVMEEKVSSSMQILFSTHSSALIDSNRLDRIRYVIKSKAAGSVVISGVDEEVDIETLMPVLTATGINSLEQLRALAVGVESQPESEVVLESAEQVFEFKQTVEVDEIVVPAVEPVVPSPAAVERALQPEEAVQENADQEAEQERELGPARPRRSLFNFFGR